MPVFGIVKCRTETEHSRIYAQPVPIDESSYLFATTALVQAYVIPSGSMERNLLVGDHLLVDRVAFSATGHLGTVLPLREVQRADIVAFRYPEDVPPDLHQAVIGVPGDRIHLENRQVVRNGHKLIEAYTQEE